jgi:hypothetical protein
LDKAYFDITIEFNFKELDIKQEDIKDEIIGILTGISATYNDSLLPIGGKINEEKLKEDIKNIFTVYKSPKSFGLEV